MKNVILATLGMGLLVMGSINTASAIDLDIVIADQCLVPAGVEQAGAVNMNFSGTDFGYTAGILSDGGATGVNAGSVDVKYAAANCNYAATVEAATANGWVTSGGTAAVGFTNGIGYEVDVAFCGKSLSVDSAILSATSAGPKSTSFVCNTPSIGDIDVSVNSMANATPLQAGTYEDTLTITVQNPI